MTSNPSVRASAAGRPPNETQALSFARRREADSAPPGWRLLWLRTALLGGGIILAVFGGYEIAERTVFHDYPVSMLSHFHMARGVGTSIILASWAFYSIMRTRRRYEAALGANVVRLEQEVAMRTRDLQRSLAFSELLFETLRARILVMEPDGRVVKANRCARESLGREVIGSSHPETELDHEKEEDAGGRIWAVEAYSLLDEQGNPLNLVEIGRDVTEERKLEAQIRHQEKMASLGLLAAGIAHDIGNPLASLSSELEVLELEDDVARFRESLGVLRSHVERIGRTLREMVDFARRRTDHEADVNVANAVADSLRLVKHDPRARRISMAVDVPPSLPRVRMVEDDLVLVLVNLLINAIDAMPDGGTLTVAAAERGDGIELTVRDSGTGMSEEVRAKALLPLFTTKAHGKGTGLGLSVAHDVLRSLNGTLELQSQPESGTTVRLLFPRTRLSLPTPEARPEVSSA